MLNNPDPVSRAMVYADVEQGKMEEDASGRKRKVVWESRMASLYLAQEQRKTVRQRVS